MEFIYDESNDTDLDEMINYLRLEIGEHGHEPPYQLLNQQLTELMRMKSIRRLSRPLTVIVSIEEYKNFITNT